VNSGEKLAIGAVVTVLLLLVGGWVLFDISTVEGNQVGVKETWGEGVIEEPFPSKTYILFPGFTQEIYTYPISTQTYVMNDTPSSIENIAEGREKDAYQIQSVDPQDMKVSMNLMYHLDPNMIVAIHKEVRTDWEERIIRPLLLRKVKDSATTYKAINAYSGAGLVSLQAEIQSALTPALAARGIVVENFAIEGIELDGAYIGEIKERLVQVQAELRAKQEEQTNLAKADAAKSAALADKFKAIVQAERDKEVGILSAEKSARVMIVDAEAKKEREVLAAEAEKEASVLRADAIVAIGEAEATAKKLALGAWAVPGAEHFVKIEVANALSRAFQNIKGYIPEDMNISVLTDTFANSVDSVMVEMPANNGSSD